MELNKKLVKDIEDYCSLNNIEDSSKFASDLLKKAFNIEKYGESPEIFKKEEKKETVNKKEKKKSVTFIIDSIKKDEPKKSEIEINEVVEISKKEEPIVEKKNKKRKLS